MLDNLSLTNFKCFSKKTDFPIKKVTVLYGRNGRGKSSFLQSILLLAQTFKERKDITNLILGSERGFVDLGLYKDVIYGQKEENSFSIELDSHNSEYSKHSLSVTYQRNPLRPTLASALDLKVDGNSIMGKMDTQSPTSTASSEVSSSEAVASGSMAQSDIPVLLELNNLWYVSANRLGPQNSQKRDDTRNPEEIGNGGEYLINVLGNQKVDFVELLRSDLSRVLSGASIRTDDNIDQEKIYLFLDSIDGNSYGYKPVNVGFGYSYILPLLVTLRLSRPGSILVLENPEAHLHPGAQSELMKLLIEVSLEKNLQLIIESHSDHIINGMRIAVKEGKLSPNLANVLHFGRTEAQEPEIKEIRVDKNGQLSSYPEDFMDEMTKQLLQLM